MPLKLEIQDLSKYVIILTGATDGIGKEMARILAKSNPKRLILPARNIEKGNKLLEYIKSSNGNANNVEIWEMDLADLQSVKNFANKFIKEVGELHILINNAGLVVQNQIVKTKDNLEIQFQVNHLAQFLLTLLLLDTIKKSVSAELPGKIALTSSELNYFGEIDFDNLNLEKGNYWNFLKSYGNTKLMNIIVAKELGRLVQNDNITTYSLHPGLIQTNVSHLNSTFSNILNRLIIKISGEITAEQGAINTLYPVFSLENKETGKYYDEGIEKEPNKVANDQEVAKKLWDVSEKILKDHGMI
ncbi:NAD(P)-binding protein [Rhizophagus irregularis]|uniref:NAD(P)-binding protein n=1 Tax=Rhizophagus irregularis TaxID=588596 RepID=A0A2N1N1B6_9GLOM|nr:NAD(P)-binding protein [Rhizophagus irregularis]